MNMDKNIETAVYVRDGKEIEFSYYIDVPMSAKLAFVNSVVGVVVGDDYYYPMLKDMIFDYQLIELFASDVNASDEVSTDDSYAIIDNIEVFLADTNIADVLKINLDIDLLMELYDAVDKAIEYKTGIHPSPIADGVASILKIAENKLRDFDMDSMTGMAKTFAKMQGDITPDKMLEAYAKSDIFKKQHEDVVKKQKERDTKMDVIMGGLNDA